MTTTVVHSSDAIGCGQQMNTTACQTTKTYKAHSLQVIVLLIEGMGQSVNKAISRFENYFDKKKIKILQCLSQNVFGQSQGISFT